MKKIIFFILLSFDLFASNPCGLVLELNPNYSPNPKAIQNNSYATCVASTPTLPPPTWDCSHLTLLVISNLQHISDCSGGFSGTGKNYSATQTTTYYRSVSSCPSGSSPDSNGVCQPDQSCPWATTPPWFATSNSQSYCANTHKDTTYYASNTSYLWNFTWCSADETCYAREYYCPNGQQFDTVYNTCKDPAPPPFAKCPDGFYKQSGSVSGPSGLMCFTDFICKTNPAIHFRSDVSCGAGPVDDAPETNPDAPVPDDLTPSPSSSDHSTMCGTKRMSAEASCDSVGGVLSFSCDPMTGNVTKSECKTPTSSDKETVDPSDSSNLATSADIKNLSNTLPDNIRKALSDYFTDGSSPYLGKISGSLDALQSLTSSQSDTLNSISTSVDSSLGRLDGIKSSLDNVASSLNSTDEYEGEDMPSDSDLQPDSNVTDGFDTFTNAFDNAKTQYDNAMAIFSNGLPSIESHSGSCPSYTFYGNTVQLSKIGDSLAPFSPIIAVLVYVILMIGIFKFLFAFFSRGI